MDDLKNIVIYLKIPKGAPRKVEIQYKSRLATVRGNDQDLCERLHPCKLSIIFYDRRFIVISLFHMSLDTVRPTCTRT